MLKFLNGRLALIIDREIDKSFWYSAALSVKVYDEDTSI